MEMTPLDIRKQEFRKKSFGGLDPEEVQAFLSQVAVTFEENLSETIALKEQLKVCKEQLNHYKLIENTLQESVMTMQQVIDEKKEVANKEAEFIIAQARANALKETEAIRNESETLRKDVQLLKSQRDNFFIRMRSVLNAQRELIQALEKDDAEFLNLEETDLALQSTDLEPDTL